MCVCAITTITFDELEKGSNPSFEIGFHHNGPALSTYDCKANEQKKLYEQFFACFTVLIVIEVSQIPTNNLNQYNSIYLLSKRKTP